MRITDRYSTAIHSSNLKMEERTFTSDVDVLAAMARASIIHPLSLALTRLFAGDNGGAQSVLSVLVVMLRGKAPSVRVKITETQAEDIAKACLAWHRNGVCRPCGGHGNLLISGSTTIGDQECKHCRGVGKVPFERQFRDEWRDLARWLVAEMEREQAKAGPVAMKILSKDLFL